MLAAVNSKKGKYGGTEITKYMINGKALAERAREEQTEREPMQGDEILRKLRMHGVPIIDKRANPTERIF